MIALVLAILIFPVLLVLLLAYLRKLRFPEKSYRACLLNISLTPLRYFRIGDFKHGTITLEKAMKYAVKKTKLTDFGGSDFIANYQTVIDCPAHKKLQLTNIGYIMYRIEMNMTMVRRLKFIQYLKDVPEVKEIPIRSPVFVMGLPRSGTTFLHRLLSLDPKVRSPLLWELTSPVPGVKTLGKEMEIDYQKRRKFIHKLIADRQNLGDNAIQHIHEIGADLPEECILSLTDELPLHMSLLYSCYLNYEKLFSIKSENIAAAYAHYKKVLQLLSYQIGETKDPRRWVLKCPIHLYYTKEIGQIFPDAKLVW